MAIDFGAMKLGKQAPRSDPRTLQLRRYLGSSGFLAPAPAVFDQSAAASIPLADAVLCLSCSMVYQGRMCPKCGDPYGWLIGRWLSSRKAA
ncbi:MAG: hypothetical protein M3O02_11110 [Acidobacteriota bacterium]|nr:hypothetical protein [Acidobacteriota bacterium]